MKEARIFDAWNTYDGNRVISDRQTFGWELQSISENKISMVRDQNMPNYDTLTLQESKFDLLLNLYLKYAKLSVGNIIIIPILLLLSLVVIGLTIFVIVDLVETYHFFHDIDPTFELSLVDILYPVFVAFPLFITIPSSILLYQFHHKATYFINKAADVIIETKQLFTTESTTNEVKE